MPCQRNRSCKQRQFQQNGVSLCWHLNLRLFDDAIPSAPPLSRLSEPHSQSFSVTPFRGCRRLQVCLTIHKPYKILQIQYLRFHQGLGMSLWIPFCIPALPIFLILPIPFYSSLPMPL